MQAPQVSPDGRWLANNSNESDRFEIYVRPFSPLGPGREGKWLISSEGGLFSHWAPGSQDLYYESLDGRIMRVSYAAKGDLFVADRPRLWSEQRLSGYGTLNNFDIARDGKRLLGTLGAVEESEPETSLHLMFNVGDELRRRAAPAARGR